MEHYESSVKQIAAPQTSVYGRLSDLTNLRAIQEATQNPDLERIILERAGGQVKPEQIEQIRDVVSKMQFDRDSVTVQTSLGNFCLRIIEREEPKCIKFQGENTPMDLNLWIQVLPVSTYQSKMRLTLGADLNFFMRQMLGNKLQDGVEKLADMLAMIPY